MTTEAPVDLAALEQAHTVSVGVSHHNRTVDTSEPLAGEPVAFEDGELVVDLDGRDAHAFISVYEHDGETVTATLGHRHMRKRDRGAKFTVDSVEAAWDL